MGGATWQKKLLRPNIGAFQSQRRFFGGSNFRHLHRLTSILVVSIAEAILWGEQLLLIRIGAVILPFQSQRRFFGGSNNLYKIPKAEAQQFQSQRRFFGGSNRKRHAKYSHSIPFQSQRRFFGGSNRGLMIQFFRRTNCFNRRGDSLGGATVCVILGQ